MTVKRTWQVVVCGLASAASVAWAGDPPIAKGSKVCETDSAKTIVVWSTPGDAKCKVSVRYHGTKECQAQFAHDGAPQGEKANQAWKDATFETKELKFKCMGEAHHECEYEISKVDCGAAGGDLTRNPQPQDHTNPKCDGNDSRTEMLNTGPTTPPKKCDFTVEFEGKEHCRAIIYGDAGELDSTGADKKLVTFQQQSHIDSKCDGAAGGRCSFKVVQKECKAE